MRLPLTTWALSTMSSQDESARLFQKMIVFKYAADNEWERSKDILVNRDTVAQYEVRCDHHHLATRPRTH